MITCSHCLKLTGQDISQSGINDQGLCLFFQIRLENEQVTCPHLMPRFGPKRVIYLNIKEMRRKHDKGRKRGKEGKVKDSTVPPLPPFIMHYLWV